MKHTQGPWFANTDVFEPVVTNSDGTQIALLGEVSGTVESGQDAECIHNARLIAAAPELLEALQNQVIRMARLAREQGIVLDVSEMQNAIAKATGGGK